MLTNNNTVFPCLHVGFLWGARVPMQVLPPMIIWKISWMANFEDGYLLCVYTVSYKELEFQDFKAISEKN